MAHPAWHSRKRTWSDYENDNEKQFRQLLFSVGMFSPRSLLPPVQNQLLPGY